MRALILPLTTLVLQGQTLYDLAPDSTSTGQLPNSVNSSFQAQTSLSPRNYFFGDSLSDTGNVASLLGTLGPGYPGDSFTNGQTWVAYLDPDASLLFESFSPVSQLLDLEISTDLSAGGATTSTVFNQQIQNLFLSASASYLPNSNDQAFLWAGGNDFIPLFEGSTAPDPAAVATTTATSLENLTNSVIALDNAGLPNIAVISLINIGLAPRGAAFQQEGTVITNGFNTSLRENLRSLPVSANLLWIDSDAFLNDAIANPGSYNLTNTTDPLAPLAQSGIPSTIPVEEQSGYLYYDDIHPSTAAHEQFARFVANHLALSTEVSDLYLVTDAALALDDVFGFENSHLSIGQSEFAFSGLYTENEAGQIRRQTTGFRSDLDYALTNNLLIGGELFYADGTSGRSELQSMGFGLDAAYRSSIQNHPGLQWETGLGFGMTWGNMTRDYQLGSLEADSQQDASAFTAHAAIRNTDWKIGSLPARWEFGIKQRVVRRNSASESDASSLNLRYEAETLSTTIANLEVGLPIHPTLDLEISLNPVLAHSGGEITAHQRDGLATFISADQSGYDLHTARASLIYRPDQSTSITAGIIAGQEKLWATNFGFGLQF